MMGQRDRARRRDGAAADLSLDERIALDHHALAA
jgi:hypothetical protein